MKYLIFIFLFVGCASKSRTQYDVDGHYGGFSDGKIEGNIRYALFRGNAYTHADDAKNFAILRSIEVCENIKKKLSYTIDLQDLTSSSTHQRSSGVALNSQRNFNGTITPNGFGGFNNSGVVSPNTNVLNSTTWNETYTYPSFRIIFQCTDREFRVGIDMEDVSAEQMKPYVKDLLGAVQIIEVLGDSPNKDIIDVGDLIIKINSKRVFSSKSVMLKIQEAGVKGKLEIEIIRDGKSKKLTAKVVDISNERASKKEAFLRNVCSTVPEIGSREICKR